MFANGLGDFGFDVDVRGGVYVFILSFDDVFFDEIEFVELIENKRECFKIRSGGFGDVMFEGV